MVLLIDHFMVIGQYVQGVPSLRRNSSCLLDHSGAAQIALDE